MDLETEMARLRNHAVRQSIHVVLANFGGPSGGLASGGGSAIWSETGELLVQLETNGPDLAVAVARQDRWRGRERLVDDPAKNR